MFYLQDLHQMWQVCAPLLFMLACYLSSCGTFKHLEILPNDKPDL